MKIQKITFMALTALLTLSLGACSLIGQKHSQKNQGGTENILKISKSHLDLLWDLLFLIPIKL